MKTKAKELDVDFIGGQDVLTVEEKKTLNDFFRQRKLDSKKSTEDKKPKAEKRRRTTA